MFNTFQSRQFISLFTVQGPMYLDI